MRRFNYDDNDEHRKEVDNFFGELDGYDGQAMTPEEYEAIVREAQEAQDLQYKLVRQEFNHRLLRTAVRMAENSFWWKFYSLGTRLQMIDRAYKKLRKLEEFDATV